MPKTYNCRKINKDKCPLKSNFLIKDVIYKVKVESKGPIKFILVVQQVVLKIDMLTINILLKI